MLEFAMKIWPWPVGRGQMVQGDQMCIYPQAFQIIKPGVDISSNSWDIAIYVKTALTSISRSLFQFMEFFTESEKPLPRRLLLSKPLANPSIIDWIMPL